MTCAGILVMITKQCAVCIGVMSYLSSVPCVLHLFRGLIVIVARELHISLCIICRYGQTKPVHVYRFVGAGTMEQKVYEVQVRPMDLVGCQRVLFATCKQNFVVSLMWLLSKSSLLTVRWPQTRKDTISKRVLDDFTADRKFERDQFYFNTDDLEDEDHAPARAAASGATPTVPGDHERTSPAQVESSVGTPNGGAPVEREKVEPSDQYTRDYHHALQDPALAAVLSAHRKLMRYFYLQAS